ncbi:MAG: SDR family oxidoreductase [Halanaeroarchaeum sp.]
MSGLLDGKTAVVTGGASGIGRQIAVRFAEEGANVVIADLQREPREENGAPTDEVASDLGVEATYAECDVTDVASLEAAVDAADEFGGIDVMVNNAGIFRGKPFTEVTEDEYETMMDVNVKGVFFGAQAAAKKLLADGRDGSIINMSSVAGLTGSANFTTYCTSKGGVRLLTYSLASELGPSGIRVNAIHPGLIETEMTTEDVPIIGTEQGEGYKQTIPMGRWGEPEDIADGALYLASDLSSYVNGESLVIDGGMTYA